jgi:hypothetical protein
MASISIDDESVTVRSTAARTVAFFAKRATSRDRLDTLGKMAVSMLDAMVTVMATCEDANVTESAAIMAYLEGLEARLDASAARGAERTVLAVRELGERVVNIDGTMKGQMMGLIQAVDGAVRSGMERLSVEAVAGRVTSAVRDYLSGELRELREGNASSAATVAALGETLKGEMRRMIEEPVALLTSLPAQLLQSLGPCHEHESAKQGQRIDELRAHVDKVSSAQQEQVLAMRLAVSDVAGQVRGVMDEVGRVIVDGRERSAEARAMVQANWEQMPRLVQSVVTEAVRSMERDTEATKLALSAAQHELSRLSHDGVLQRKSLDDVILKLEAISQQLAAQVVQQTRLSCSQKHKGQQGEARLFDLLSGALSARDGYEVEMVNGQSHACDISIKRLGYGEVRVENKAHGAGTSEKVRHKEVARFCSDLMGLRCHGIFISQHSGIVGKGEVELEILANHKVAVYVSNCDYDVARITDVLRLVYQLDKILEGQDEDGPSSRHLRVSAEAMKRVTVYLKDFGNKVATAKTHLKESLSILSEMTFDMIEKVLLGAEGNPHACAGGPTSGDRQVAEEPASTTVDAGGAICCNVCGRAFATRQGMNRHKTVAHGRVAG